MLGRILVLETFCDLYGHIAKVSWKLKDLFFALLKSLNILIEIEFTSS